jgi:DNA processing protein
MNVLACATSLNIIRNHGAEMISTSQPSDAIRLARAYLSRVAEPYDRELAALVADVGPVEAAQRTRSGDLASSGGAPASARRAEDIAHQDIERITAVGGRLVIPEDDEWPAQRFAALSEAADRGHELGGEPLALWVRGPHQLSSLVRRAVALVGSRAASGYGEHVASEWSYSLARQDVTVVASASYGIGGAANRSALAADGLTIAVLPCGADVAYPTGHQALLSTIAKRGLLVSEYPPGVTPARHRSMARSRILAALGAGTVVVEAGRRSGAKHAAATTIELGRVLMAVPGPVTSATSIGCHELLRQGHAVPVSSVEEIVDSVANFDDEFRP